MMKHTMCGRLDFGHGEIRMNVEDDRLSSLPDELIHEILSYISLRQVIGMSVLSTRWKSIWTSMPYLNFSNKDFIPDFVSNVLSHRNNQIQLSSVKLVPRGPVNHESVKTILNYAFSHNVQQLNVINIAKNIIRSSLSSKGTPTWNLQALTTLHLNDITLTDEYTDKCTGLFSKCINLKNLSLSRCKISEMDFLMMSLPRLSNLRLSNLTFEYTKPGFKGVSVVAPQLKNLIVKCCDLNHLMMISAPGLTSLVMKGNRLLKLCTDGFRNLEKIDICIYNTLLEDPRRVVCLLQQLRSVKLLTLNLGILEFLSSSVKLMPRQPYVFPKVKILSFTKSFPVMVCLEVQTQEKVTMSTEISDMFTMVSYEEIRVIKSIISAQTLLEDLQGILKSKNRNNTNKDHMHEHGKPQVKKQWAHSTLELQGRFRKMMADIEQGESEGLLMKKNGHMVSKLRQMISSLECIEDLLTGLPASKRDVMQATFSSLFEDAVILMNNVL